MHVAIQKKFKKKERKLHVKGFSKMVLLGTDRETFYKEILTVSPERHAKNPYEF